MATTYQIHPAIGIARVGNSKDSYYYAPDTEGSLPYEINSKGKRVEVTQFKDSSGCIKRQGARFSIFVYDEANKEGRPLKKGDVIQGIGSKGKLLDIEWTVHLANKKSSWYQFAQLEGEHGYAPEHPRRNPQVTDGNEREMLIIDPGPQTVYNSASPQSAEFAKGKNPGYAQIFPPELQPNSIETLGEIRSNGDLSLTVLGGYGNSGSYKQGFGQPRIDHYANNDGWFDDISDGPVSARLIYCDEVDEQVRYVGALDPSWVIVGYPAYAPQIVDTVTLDEVVYNLSVRNFAFNTYLYGTEPFDRQQTVEPEDLKQWRLLKKRYNPDYYPYFYREIWPILQRPSAMQWVTTILAQSLNPHNTSDPRGNFYLPDISQPPQDGVDKYRDKRMYIYKALRRPEQENAWAHTDDPDSRLYDSPYMPLLCGDNPLSNSHPSKFLSLTETMMFLLKQWADGKFINEKDEGLSVPNEQVDRESATTKLDRGVLSNALGGSFCPGGETCWIIRNPDIYLKPYRINANMDYIPSQETSNVATTPGVTMFRQPALSHGDNPIGKGLEPGDITKYSAVPWQSDFNECSTQPIEVEYELWSVTYPENAQDKLTSTTLWWPSHRPLQVQVQLQNTPPDQAPKLEWVEYARGIPQDSQGDLKMVTAWSELGFVVNQASVDKPNFVEIEGLPVSVSPWNCKAKG